MRNFLSGFEFLTNSLRKSSLAKSCCSCEPFSFLGLWCALVHADQLWFELNLSSSRAVTSGQIHYSLILQSWNSLVSNSWSFSEPDTTAVWVVCAASPHGQVKWLWANTLTSIPPPSYVISVQESTTGIKVEEHSGGMGHHSNLWDFIRFHSAIFIIPHEKNNTI